MTLPEYPSELHRLFASRKGWLEVAAVAALHGKGGTDYVLRLDGTYFDRPSSSTTQRVVGLEGVTVADHIAAWVEQINRALMADGMEALVTVYRPPN